MAETLQFKTELKQLLHLIIHSLYSHKDIFLRELISNASDAIDTARFQSLTNPEIVEGDEDWKIKIHVDEANGTLTISDNGIGMSRASIVDNLGTIAKSGTRAFLESLKEAKEQNRPELIGQFGVGFYASFMVADKVTVISRMAGKPEDGVQWESDGHGEFTIAEVTKAKRGTDVILHIRTEDKEYLQPWRLRQLVKKYSDFVAHPIVMDKTTEEGAEKAEAGEETLNARKALWLRPRSEVTEAEYLEFYKHLSHDPDKPAKTIHYAAEGAIEFKALLYLPAHKPFDLMWGDKAKGLQLFIQRVFIMDDAEILLPRYLRFVRGVVDSPDLPLNVSRELLQQSAPLEKIKSNLTNKILNTLDEMKKREYEEYVKFYEEMGAFLKEGLTQDWANREKLADLLLFQSTKTSPTAGGTEKYTTLSHYLETMPAEQTEIYYLTGDNRELMDQSPHLEAFKAKGWEVLLLSDPIDEFVADSFREYKGKKLKAVDKGGLDAAGLPEDKKKEFQPLLDYFKDKLPDIKEARLTSRLKESAVCLVAEEGDLSANMERLLERMGRERPTAGAKRVLEVNPDHPLIQTLEKLRARDAADPRLEKTCRLLFDQAVITEGSKVKDPLAFAQRMNELIMGGIS